MNRALEKDIQSPKEKPKLQSQISIAPMMGRTDRHYRFFMRQITQSALLYSEMISTQAILRGDQDKLLSFSPIEKPISLQLGGSNPKDLGKCALIGEKYGYDEINLNVGCPSNRVQDGNFGACLMSSPHLVAECLSEMISRVNIPVTIKHRIGIDGLETYEDLANFIKIISQSGCERFIIHARIAILKGLSTQQNRTVPPLRHEEVHQIKRDFPELLIETNGGVQSLTEAMFHVKHLDGVMVGRAAYDNPYLFGEADSIFFEKKDQGFARHEVLERLIPYIEQKIKEGMPSSSVIRHTHGIFFGKVNSKEYKRYITRRMFQHKDSAIVLKDYLKKYGKYQI